MLKCFKVENYRCIQDLSVTFDSMNLLVGQNGSGKSSLFDALAVVRAILIDHEDCEDVFPLATVPQWVLESENRIEQKFLLEMESEWGVLSYRLIIAQDLESFRPRILEESLLQGSSPLFSFREGMARPYSDDHSPGNPYRAEDTRSAMAGVPSVAEYAKMTWFKRRVARILCLRIEAPQMNARSEKDAAVPNRGMTNFASWYRRALLSDASAGLEFLRAVREVIPGLNSLDLRELGQGVMILEAVFRSPENIPGLSPLRSGKYRVAFNELSDGQRALVALYALLHFLVKNDTTVWIDEPDNYIALAELQPWLNSLMDMVEANNAQVLLASHHPEMYNLLAADHGIVLERTEAGPTIAKRYQSDPDSPLSPAERAARGY